MVQFADKRCGSGWNNRASGELNQNNELLRSESRQALQSNDQVSLVLAMEHIDLYEKLGQTESLSQADQYGHGLCSSWICEIENVNMRRS